MSALTAKRYCVTIQRWESHAAVVEASSQEEAETAALALWESDSEAFSFKDGGIDGVTVEVMPL